MSRDFSGTGIVTPFEKMRANAIIGASNDEAGLSMIHFNITAFMAPNRQKDAYHILCEWAVEPMRQHPEKFIRHASAGQQALCKRADFLIENLQKRPDMPSFFLERAKEHMHNCIKTEMTAAIGNNQHQAL